MVEVQRIIEPSSLSNRDITIKLSSLSVETSKPSHSESQTQSAKLVLVLLQPLANADTLTACRNPQSSFIHTSDGSICGPSNCEFLDIRSLGLAWRQAVAKAAPISQVVFDLTMPKGDESTNAFQKYTGILRCPGTGCLLFTRRTS